MDGKFLKPYDPQKTEDNIYKIWEESGFFNPDLLPERNKKGEPYTIVLPPPNVTGTLHMGHAAMLAIEDIMIRYKRMCGYRTLWLPGTDHAAIATQSKVEKELEKKEKKRRHDLGREEFLKRVEQYAKNSHDTIVHQLRKMGASVDWSREAFTLDNDRTLAVRTAFKAMYDLGLIYRGYKIVNWDPKGQTTISDDEIVYEERKGKLYTFKYDKQFPIAIATTRPETKVGDVAVAVHPDDKRYKDYIGKEYKVNFAGVELKIKIIGDNEVDPQFGTGAVGITPAHSLTDAVISERHSLPSIQVINEIGRMKAGLGLVSDQKISEARETIINWLRENSLLQKEEDLIQNIQTAERSGGTIEPLPKLQWFVAVNKEIVLDNEKFKRLNALGIIEKKEVTLKELMKGAVASEKIKIIPDRFEKVYYHWIDNLRDWCISRQIWYGHRIPVWYRKDEKEKEDIYVGTEQPKGNDWKQDEDTLDTWFSSGLWTFSTLGWPRDNKDLEIYHPTNVLETGYDILFFWVARMILMTTVLLGDIPFHTVYLHGLVRDEKGRKMSKSLDNIIDPLDMIAKYGADAARLSLIVGTGPGNDLKLSEDKIRGYKNFANKIWNITRYVLSTVEGEKYLPAFGDFTDKDKELKNEWSTLQKDITDDMENFRFYLAGEKLYAYTWHRLADIVIEESKEILKTGKEEDKKSRKQLLLHILIQLLKALHPFMPYITEEIWSSLPIEGKSLLIVEKWS